jgi:2-polyprenyl-3-methyl-5-hydroxy-6-metoxy-1,4-benzoquinol methylase
VDRDIDADAEPPNPAHLIEEFRAFERTLALRAAIEMDLFTQIESGVDTVPQLSLACGASERGIRILCDFLTVAGHLLKRSDRYGLPLNSRLYLVATSPAYIGSAVRFLASDENLQSFGQLAQSVRNGGAERTILDDGSWVGFARFMAGLAGPVARVAAAALDLTPDRPLAVLDIAAGHGLYGLAVAARNPAAHVFAIDAPAVLDVAARNAQLAGAAERYHLIPGDAFDVRFGGPYDLIIMANFAHHFDVATNTALFRKCRAALTPSGVLALIEFVPNDDRVSPGPDAAFALTMLATTSKGDAYTFREFSRMLHEAGFSHVGRPDLGDLPHCLVTASV